MDTQSTNNPNSTTIVLAHTQYLIRLGLHHLIAQHSNLKIIGEAKDKTTLQSILTKEKPDLLIFDYNSPSHYNIDDIEWIQKVAPATKIMVISNDNSKTQTLRALELGINSYLTQSCDKEEIINAIFACIKNEKFFCNKVVNLLLEKSFVKEPESCEASPLTAREREILCFVAQGKTAQEIAKTLFLSKHTIYTHRKNIAKKLNIQNPSELVLYAIEQGYI